MKKTAAEEALLEVAEREGITVEDILSNKEEEVEEEINLPKFRPVDTLKSKVRIPSRRQMRRMQNQKPKKRSIIPLDILEDSISRRNINGGL